MPGVLRIKCGLLSWSFEIAAIKLIYMKLLLYIIPFFKSPSINYKCCTTYLQCLCNFFIKLLTTLEGTKLQKRNMFVKNFSNSEVKHKALHKWLFETLLEQHKVISIEKLINTLCGQRTLQQSEAYPVDGQALQCTSPGFLSAAVGSRTAGVPALEHAAPQVAF